MTTAQQPIVETVSGKVRGVSADGVRRWLSIPYAQADRFAAPAPAKPWPDVRDTTMSGPQCPQMMGSKPKPKYWSEPAFSEDCLTVDVYVPEDGSDSRGKPVYVWIHGGAFMAGSGNSYDGAAMAKSGDIVVVTINYRIGVLGFVNFGDALGLPDIPSNLGLRDQIAALEWVQDNIAAFGGDPAKVTFGGLSAGSMSVSLLMLARAARGLFRGAIMQSGAVSLLHDREKSRAVARLYIDFLGLNQGCIDRLRTMPLADLFAAQCAAMGQVNATIPASPWYDDDLLPATLDDMHRHDAAPVPLIAGATRDESRLFELMGGGILPSKWEELEDLLIGQLGEAQAGTILASYPRTKAGRRALATDLTFLMPTRNFAERHASQGHPTWFYRFDYAHPLAGAAHGLDLTLTWPMSGLRAALARGGRLRGARAALGERMVSHYAHFVRTLRPGADWPAYRPDDRKVKIFGIADRTETDPEAERFAAWAGRDVGPGLSAPETVVAT